MGFGVVVPIVVVGGGSRFGFGGGWLRERQEGHKLEREEGWEEVIDRFILFYCEIYLYLYYYLSCFAWLGWTFRWFRNTLTPIGLDRDKTKWQSGKTTSLTLKIRFLKKII